MEEVKNEDCEIRASEESCEEPEPEIKETEKSALELTKMKKKGQTRERMLELHKIRSEKARKRREEREELKAKEEEVKNIIKEKINLDYEEAQKIKQAIEEKKSKKSQIKEEVKEMKHTYKAVSRDILKEKYLEEAKRRVMQDLFS